MFIAPSTNADTKVKKAAPLRLDLLFWWNAFTKIPLIGRWLFSFFLGLLIPYSGTIKFKVLDIQSGYALLEMKDRWHLRNHFGSIHAAALTNLLELTSGLSLFSILPLDCNAIITNLSIHYEKKGRGLLLAECISASTQEGPYQNSVAIMDADGKLVARGKGFWHIGNPPALKVGKTE